MICMYDITAVTALFPFFLVQPQLKIPKYVRKCLNGIAFYNVTINRQPNIVWINETLKTEDWTNVFFVEKPPQLQLSSKMDTDYVVYVWANIHTFASAWVTERQNHKTIWHYVCEWVCLFSRTFAVLVVSKFAAATFIVIVIVVAVVINDSTSVSRCVYMLCMLMLNELNT